MKIGNKKPSKTAITSTYHILLGDKTEVPPELGSRTSCPKLNHTVDQRNKLEPSLDPIT